MKTEQLGTYTLTWSDGVFPLGADALALGAFATIRPRWSICDFGTGSGVLLLLLAGRAPGLRLHGAELNPLSVQSAQYNLEQNGLSGEIIAGDLRDPLFPAGQFDLVISNPPYFPVGSGKSGGPARSEESCSLAQLCAAAARLVKNGGRFTLCHRPDRLVDVVCMLRSNNLEPKRIKLVSHSPGKTPCLLLVEAIKQGRPGLEFVL